MTAISQTVVGSHAAARSLRILLVSLLAGAVSACGGVRVEVSDTPAQQACKGYAQALIDASNGASKETATADIERALSVALNDSSEESRAVADAIQSLLTESVMGTNESVIQANDAVIRACGGAGVSMEMVE
jgi:hypothetical protein